MITQHIELTPDHAKTLLNANTCNRPLSDATVKKYAAVMIAGGWVPGVAEVAISERGVMVNGQHTCWACLESGRSVRVKLTTGLPAEAVLAWDQANTRRAAQSFALDLGGSKEEIARNTKSGQIATAIFKVMCTTNRVSAQEIAMTVKRHAGAIQWVQGLPYTSGGAGFNSVSTRAALAIAYGVDAEKTATLAERAIVGVGEFKEGDLALLLRQVVASRAFNEGSSGRRERALKILRVCQDAILVEPLSLVRAHVATFNYFAQRLGYPLRET
jgi:hypothetical protein